VKIANSFAAINSYLNMLGCIQEVVKLKILRETQHFLLLVLVLMT